MLPALHARWRWGAHSRRTAPPPCEQDLPREETNAVLKLSRNVLLDAAASINATIPGFPGSASDLSAEQRAALLDSRINKDLAAIM